MSTVPCNCGLQLFVSQNVLIRILSTKIRGLVKRLHGFKYRLGEHFKWTGEKTSLLAKASTLLSLSEAHATPSIAPSSVLCHSALTGTSTWGGGKHWNEQGRTRPSPTLQSFAHLFPPTPSSGPHSCFPTFGLSVPLLQEREEKVLRNGSTRASWNVGLLLSIRSCVLRDQRFYPSFPTSSNNSWRVCRQPQHLIWQHRPPRAVILCSELVGQGNRPGLSKTHKYPRQLLLDVFDSIKEHRWSSHKMSALSLVALVTLVSTGELGWLHCTSSWLFLGRC